MTAENIVVKPLDGTAVICQTSTCEKPALYLFFRKETKASCAAHCEVHSREFAARHSLLLPPANAAGDRRPHNFRTLFLGKRLT
jgi:hypothetical protein